MGGTLNVHSKVHVGSVFYFTVLLKPGQEVSESDPQVVEMKINLYDTKLEKTDITPPILLVEDNTENQRLAQKILEKNDFSVKVVANGIQCLDWLSHNEASLVIMDINMPQMDGFETTHRIRSGECGLEKAAVPIIGLTASALQETQERALFVGMNAVLTKPFQPETLLQIINRHKSL